MISTMASADVSGTVYTQTDFVIEEPTVPSLWDPSFSNENQAGGVRKYQISGREQLDSLAQFIVSEIAVGNRQSAPAYTGVGTVFSEMINQVEGGMRTFSQMNVRIAEDIQYLGNHSRLIQKMNASVWAFVRTRPVVTLYEADLLIRKLCCNYERILGPLLKLPVIIETFNPSAQLTLPPMQLTCCDIIQDLINWTPNRMWRTFGHNNQPSGPNSAQQDPAGQVYEFEKFLCGKYGCANIEDLGVRIRSFRVLMHTSFMCVKDYSIRNIEKKCEKHLSDVIGNAYYIFKRKIQSILPLDGQSAGALMEYREMSTKDLLTSVFTKYSQLGESLRKYHIIANPQASDFRPFKSVNQLLSDLLQPDCLAVRHLFCLALCMSRIEVDNLTKKWAQHPSITTIDIESEDECEVVGVTSPKSKTEIKKKEVENSGEEIFIDLSAEDVPLDGGASAADHPEPENILLTGLLSKMSSADGGNVEELKNLLKASEKSFQDWSQLLKSDSQPFLKFLLQHASTIGLSLPDSASQSDSENCQSSVSISSDHVTHFLNSIPNLNCLEMSEVVPWVVDFFHLDAKYLSPGESALLTLLHESHQKAPNADPIILHEESLRHRQLTAAPSRMKSGAVHSLDRVLTVMSGCPVLVSIQSFMVWNLVYRPYWGDLEAFVMKHAVQVSGKDILVLRSSGKLIRLFSRATIESLSLRLTQLSEEMSSGSSFSYSSVVEIAGEIVSLLVIHRDNECYEALLTTVLEECLEKWRNLGLSVEQHVLFTQILIATMPPVVSSSFIKQSLLPCVHRIVTNCGPSSSSSISFQHFLQHLPHYPVDSISLSSVADVTSCSGESPSTRQRLITHCHTIGLLEQIDEWIECFQNIPAEIPVIEEAEMTESENWPPISDTPASPSVEESDPVPCKLGGGESLDERSLIENIRRSEFGIGLEMSNETKQVLECYQSRLTRSLGHLSEDLYSKHCHFLLELIQNADDNQYTSSTAEGSPLQPTLEFRFVKGQLLVLNNEDGFSEKDIRALCDIGKSTKVGDKIGRKGIGFKSVFLISDEPRIHSRQFHLKFLQFDADSHQSKKTRGGIVPEWIDCVEREIVERGRQWNTQIILPLRQEEVNIRTDIERGLLLTIEPKLLLFLRRISRIRAVTSQRESVIERVKEENPNVVSITDGEQVTSWFIHHSKLSCDSTVRKLRGNHHRQSTNVSLAIPLSTPIRESQALFAYLPLRSFGLKFILNCDFDIPASREDISEDSVWNLWLLQQVPRIFLQLVKKVLLLYQKQTVIKTEFVTISAAELLQRLLDCVPLPLEVDTQFREVAAKIRSLLSDLACLPDINANLKPPSKLLLPEGNLITQRDASDLPQSSQLFSLLKERCGVNTLSDTFLDTATDLSLSAELKHRRLSVLSHLGCQPLGLRHWLELTSMLTEEEKIEDLSLMRDLFFTLESHLINLTPSERHTAVTSLQSLPLLPLKGGTLGTASLQSNEIFIWREDCGLSWQELHSQLMANFSLINPLLHQETNGLDVKLSIFSFLNRLGVEVLTKVSLLNKLILPRLQALYERASSPCEEDCEWIVTASRFLFTNYSQTILKSISSRIPVVVCDQQSLQPRLIQIETEPRHCIYFSNDFIRHQSLPHGLIQCHMVKLFQHFQSVEVTLVSASYLHADSDDVSMETNRSILRGLQCLGVSDIPRIRSIRSSGRLGTLQHTELSPRVSQWVKVLYERGRDRLLNKEVLDHVTINIEDFEIPELTSFVSTAIFTDERWEAMGEVVQLLLNNWHNWSSFSRIKVSVSSVSPEVSDVLNQLLCEEERPLSHMVHTLQTNDWLPSQFVDQRKLMKPIDVFTATEFMKFGSLELDSLILCRPSMSIINREIIETLSFKREIQPVDLKNILAQCLSCDSSKLTLRAMKSLYIALLTTLSKPELHDLFKGDLAVIFMPHENSNRNSFKPLSHFYWEDVKVPNNLKVHNWITEIIGLDSLRHQALLNFYSGELEPLFVDALNISRYPSILSVLPVTRQIHNIGRSLPNRTDLREELVRHLVTWYHLLSLYLSEESGRNPPSIQSSLLIKMCQNEPVLLGHHGDWRPFHRETIFACDSNEYRNLLLESQSKVAFLAYGARFIDLYRYYQSESCSTDSDWERRGERRDACDFLFNKLKILILDDLVQEKVTNKSAFIESAELTRFLTPLKLLLTKWLYKQEKNYPKPESKHRLKTAINRFDRLKRIVKSDELLVEIDFGPIQTRLQRNFTCRCLEDTVYVHSGSILTSQSDGTTVETKVQHPDIVKELARFLLGEENVLSEHFSKFVRGFLDTISYNCDIRVLSVFLSSHGLKISDLPREYRPAPPVRDEEQQMRKRSAESTPDNSVLNLLSAPPAVSGQTSGEVAPSLGAPSLGATSLGAPSFGATSLFSATTSRSRPLPGKILRLGTDSGSRIPVTFPSEIAKPIVNLRTTESTETQSRSAWTPSFPPGPTSATAQALGQWGEEVVFHHLKNSTKLGEIRIISVEWMNETGGSVLPYDILVQLAKPWPHADNSPRRQDVMNQSSHFVYIEVKTTFDREKRDFDISLNQVEFACQHREKFHLFRVFNAQDPNNLVMDHVPDLYSQLMAKKILLKMLI